MKFYKQYWGFLFEFNSIGEFIWFTIGRVIGVILFILLIFGWWVLLYLTGYIESLSPILTMFELIYELFRDLLF